METEGLWFTTVAHVVSVSWAVLVACVCMDSLKFQATPCGLQPTDWKKLLYCVSLKNRTSLLFCKYIKLFTQIQRLFLYKQQHSSNTEAYEYMKTKRSTEKQVNTTKATLKKKKKKRAELSLSCPHFTLQLMPGTNYLLTEELSEICPSLKTQQGIIWAQGGNYSVMQLLLFHVCRYPIWSCSITCGSLKLCSISHKNFHFFPAELRAFPHCCMFSTLMDEGQSERWGWQMSFLSGSGEELAFWSVWPSLVFPPPKVRM